MNTSLLVIAVLFGAYFLYQSRRWTGPAQSARFIDVEDEQRVIRGNLKRLERDVREWHRNFTDSLEAIMRELQAIQRNGAKEQPLEREIRDVKDRVDDMEQVVSSLPCQPQCPTPKAAPE